MARQEMDQGTVNKARVQWTPALLWLAVIGVFPLSLAPWGTWVIVREAFHFSPYNSPVTYVQESLPAFMGLSHFLWAHGLSTPVLGMGMGWFGLAVEPAGIFPALALVWSRGNDWAMRAYLTWLAVVTALAATAANQLFSEPFCNGPDCHDTVVIVSRQPGWGAWTTLGALVLLWVAAAVRIFASRAALVSTTSRLLPASQPAAGVSGRTVLRRSSAAVFTLGTLLWGFGLILVPWATNNCTGFPIAWAHFFDGTCAGLDANDTINFVWRTPIVERGLDFTLVIVFMGLLGIITMGALWRTGWGGLVVATIWTALATWLVLQLNAVLATMLQYPPKITGDPPTHPWVSGAGLLVTSAGLAVVGIAVIGAWIAAIGSYRGEWTRKDVT